MNARLAALALAAMLWCGAPAADAPRYHGVDISGADYARDFDLTDHDGRRRTLADFRGKLVVIFFGYLQCPNFCPLTLARMAEVKQRLGADAARLQVLFLTLDPERDTPGALKEYVTAFDPAFLGLYTDAARTKDLALAWRVYYDKVDGPTPASYSLDHAIFSYVFDTEGRLRLLENFDVPADRLAADLRRLLHAQP